MRFTHRKTRRAPGVIVIALIDVLIVLLIFLMVTSSFRQTPALKLALPESKQPRQGTTTDAGLIVTIAKSDPRFWLDKRPVTFDRLEGELRARRSTNENFSVSIRADKDAAFGQVIRVMDAAKAANIKYVNAFTENPSQGSR